MSLGLIFLPERIRRFLILLGSTPWRRSVACTWFSPPARISPRTILPCLSLPSHSKTYSLISLDAAVAMSLPRRYRDGRLCAWQLFVGDGQYFLQRGQAHFDFVEPGFAQRTHTFELGLGGNFEGAAVGQDDALHLFRNRHHLVNAYATFVTVVAS